ncbi:MAG: NAD-dependent epimerase/dehydratase family protein, partial [Bdellovibrionales bacterium]|nr:NAD-dependent epimerase/dehydratase family protein [Bdellovibrionales bacterium]
MTNESILITGCNGELGHGLIHCLEEIGNREIIGIDLKADPELSKFKYFTFHQGDILDQGFLDFLFKRYNFSQIFHLAALLSTAGERDPVRAYQVNVTGSLNLLERARMQGAARNLPVLFLFPSSIAVYGMGSVERKVRSGKVIEQ